MKKLILTRLCILIAVTLVFVIAPRAQNRFDSCLENGINLEDLVVSSKKATVKQRLTSLKARCRRGKLVDRKLREIRFFKTECWGNPPADYLEIQRRERAELARLRKKYTVVLEIACPPTGMLPY